MFTTTTSIDEFLKLHTGDANAESPHLAVPLYVPLTPSWPLAQGLQCVTPELREEVSRREVELLAVACGTMHESDRLQLIFFRHIEDGYMTFSTLADEYEMAVLMDGDGRRYLSPDPLPRNEAVARWMAGYLNWNCEVPGLYRLRYALIEPAEGRPQS